jgi:uncharacterized protein YjbJ (UPF0337 family)
MTQDIIRDKWLQLRGQLKAKWNRLTDDDVRRLGGHRAYLVGKLQERYGMANQKAKSEVEEFERALR